ncbi:TonB-dependent siderophore receptor [Steroidobacter sp.]|uniref:TonB-dependent siderophore receptor n=1 Tax=Steroidobacter sp. TaxID=1978227 RepID=UPI001A468B00|nr:TonB-dependent receptor [Steroidobacter sp.]MBL8267813.1 TonB-dependent siderophore receptor [Steroidobacter sp.]
MSSIFRKSSSHRLRVIVAALCLATSSINAAELDRQVRFDIPAQALSPALIQFSSQTNVQIITKAQEVSGLATAGVNGLMPIDAALKQLLQGTGVSYALVGNDTVEIGAAEGRPAGDAASKAEQSTSFRLASLNDAGAEAASDRATATTTTSADGTMEEMLVKGQLIDNVSMMKRGETMRETPQSVTIMTRQRIEEQQLLKINEVIDQAPGMTVESDFFGKPALYYSRGFEISNMQIDGASVDVNRSYFFNPNLAMYEQVEILRGADGLFAGSGDPGGTINLVRKRARHDPQMQFNASAGRWNNFNAEVDVTGPLAFDGRLRGRAVATWHDREYYYDTAAEDGTFFYGTLEADVTDSTLLVVGGNHESIHQSPLMVGVPRFNNGTVIDLPISTAYMADWNKWDQKSTEFFARVEQRLGDDWLFSVSGTHGESEQSVLYASVDMYSLAPGAQTMAYTYGPYDGYAGRRNTFDLSLKGTFELFGRRHNVLVGYDRQKTNNEDTLTQFLAPPSGTVNVYDFDPLSIPRPGARVPLSWSEAVTEQSGIYAKVQLQIADPLKITFGGRYASFDYSAPRDYYAVDGSVTSSSTLAYEDSGVFIPYGSVLYDVSEDWTIYGSVTEIYKSQSSSLAGPLPGTPLDPMTGRNYEVGVKSDLRDGRLGFSFSLYRTEREGEAEFDPAYLYTLVGNVGHSCCYLELGEVLSQGVDTEITGELAPGWSIFSGYTYNDSKNERTDTPLLTVAPKHMFKLWSSYKIPSMQQRWLVGGGVTVQSRTSSTAWGVINGTWTQNPISQGSYAVVNAMAQYRINPQWSLALNGNNLLDRQYFSNLQYQSRYAEPRNFMLSVRASF